VGGGEEPTTDKPKGNGKTGRGKAVLGPPKGSVKGKKAESGGMCGGTANP